MTIVEMEAKIRQLLAGVPGDNREFVMSFDTHSKYFGSRHKNDFTQEFRELVKGFPVRLEITAGDDIYLVEKPATPVKETHECTECGDEIDEPGLCVFCFAIASVGGLG